MAESPSYRPEHETLERPQHPRLDAALSGMSLLLGLKPGEAEALRGHFAPYATDRTYRNSAALAKAGWLFKDYFENNRHVLNNRFFERSEQRRQKQMRAQRALAVRLFGDRANAINPVPLSALLQGREDIAPAIIEDVEDALIDVVIYFAKRHHLDRQTLLGEYASGYYARPAPVETRTVEAVVEPEPAPEPEPEAEEPAIEPDLVEEGIAEPQPPRDDEPQPTEPEPDIDAAAEEDNPQPEPAKKTRQRRIKWGAFALAADDIDPTEYEGPTVLGLAKGKPEAAYLGATRLNKRLSREEIETLSARIAFGAEAARRIEAGDYYEEELPDLHRQAADGSKARRVFAVHNLGLAVEFVRRYNARYVEFDDAVQTANVALLESVENFDPYYNLDDDGTGDAGEFSTLALLAIKQRVFQFYQRERRRRGLILAASNDDAILLERSYQEAAHENPEITYEEVGEWLGFNPAMVSFLREGKQVQRILSLDHRYGDETGDGEELVDLISDMWSAGDFAKVDNELAGVRFWEYLGSVLPKSDFRALYLYYVNNYTQDEIAEEIGLSRQRVGQLIGRGHDRIRRAVEGRDPRERRKRGKSKRKDGARTFFRKLGIPVAEDADPDELRKRMSDIFNALDLNLTEGAIMRLRYGLGSEGDTEMSQQETAAKLQVSRGHVSQVDPKVIRMAKEHLGLVQPDTEDQA